MAAKSGELVGVSKSRPVTLSKPLKRGEDEITEVMMSEPNNGATRGLQIFGIMQGDIQQLSVLLPRITKPMITETEFQNMPFKDQAAFAGEVLYFLD